MDLRDVRHGPGPGARGEYAIQNRLRSRVLSKDRFREIRTVGGADVAYDRSGTLLAAAVAVLSFPDLAPLEVGTAGASVAYPYVPGLLGFREVPAVLEALEGLRRVPDLLLVEGHGTAHPRGFGAACHTGLAADLPCVGVAKSRLVGTHRRVGEDRGAWEPVVLDGTVVGAAVRTRHGVRPVYVSVGHRVSLETAIRFVLDLSPRFRLPEPIRQAHACARAALERAP